MPRGARTADGSMRQRSLAGRMASEFDAVALHNKVHDVILEDVQLGEILDAVARAGYAYDTRDDIGSGTDDLQAKIENAEGELSWVAEQRAREVVAEACATIITDGDQWVAEGHWEQDSIDDAQHAARDWLQANTNVADRVGVLEEVHS